MPAPDEDWVCAMRVEFSDGTHETRVIHRGSERECNVVAGNVPLREVRLPDRPMNRHLATLAESIAPGMGPPKEVVVWQPPGKVAVGATVIVCHPGQLST